MSGSTQVLSKELIWPGGGKIAISLSYDDALNSQLDNAIPALDSHNLKASFYILPNAPTMNERMEEWRAASERGHELGNHTIYHPCRASLPNREWVAVHHDLDRYSVAQMVEEITTANTFLKALDGKNERTLTIPCGDTMKGGDNYLSKVEDSFIAIKGQGMENGFSVIYTPVEVTGKELIDYIKNIPAGVSLINVIFHGVGGDYLSVSSEAHATLLNFLVKNNETYYVDSFINIMKFANTIEL
jgi:peptidoglycan/xylan/chitin deacetylase (PgdA/CDA1 family)